MNIFEQDRINRLDVNLASKYERLTGENREIMRARCRMAGTCETCMHYTNPSNIDELGEFKAYCRATLKGAI